MKTHDVTLQIRDEELMDEIRESEQVYVAGVKYDVDGYTIGPDPEHEENEEVMIAGLDRTFKNNVLRCPMDDCNGERIKVEDARFAGGVRWECNNCDWVQEA